MGLDHPDHIFGTILDVYAAAGSIRTNDFIDNSRPCDHIRKLCGSSHNTPKFVTHLLERQGVPRVINYYPNLTGAQICLLCRTENTSGGDCGLRMVVPDQDGYLSAGRDLKSYSVRLVGGTATTSLMQK